MRISALSTILALGLWVGPAVAGDADSGAPAADDMLVATGDQLDSSAMSAATGGHVDASNVAIEVARNENTFIVDDGGQINTGSLNSSNTNSGGITVNLLNTGAGVVMQNATNINIILGGGGLD